uniref:Photosystem II Q(B) protein (D1) n=1 Tax=Heterosigma akashiwo TaxID=2829 RepID=A0A224AMN9_HETAK|nr:photosystem II Q(b) protein (D1) [Heterosigma akashiwo]BBA18175.1 photosystem II Q(b) protein (D1) [Heterosigma akashiwo]BBA18276.1 photosystem II Q(b) protein (D1) [Heterosigma akashiwo]BBA18314.1 photosystem II Q(b) protein (D1) [Heterosigma akashiwo]BBA18415.1 photosystem II Q(b) protein (D1) [Heterosigma akashiwo]
MNLVQLGILRIQQKQLLLEQRMLRRSMDAYLNGSLIPTHDPCKKQHLIRSVKRLVGKDHHCITTRLKKQLPKLGRSVHQ